MTLFSNNPIGGEVKQHIKLGEILVQDKIITQEQLLEALEEQKKNPNEALGSVLVRMGFVSDKNVASILARQLHILYAAKDKGLLRPFPDQNLDKIIPEEFARRNCLMPISLHANTLTVVFSDPLDIVLLDNLHKMTGYRINRLISTKSEIEQAISEFYGEGGMLKSAIDASYVSIEPRKEDLFERLTLDDLVASAEKAPVVKLTDLLLRQAIKNRASDIHIEPFDEKLSIRFRIDGVLQEIPPPEKSMLLPLVSRIKILCKMDIAEKRLPQDGSFSATIDKKQIDFRVSTIPTVHGEKVVLRILDRHKLSLNLSNLGFEKEELENFRKIIRKPYGMVLLTGPTGSGKTTTLYSALNEIKGVDKNIITIEDPVEYQITGINQVQVKPAIGLTFAAGLRAFLRQDPDVMLVGEIRDLETAQICVRAALTGHLVFSSLHTNDAPSAVARLADIGIESFYVASSLLMVVAQRLLRKLCPKCKEATDQIPPFLMKKRPDLKTIYKPKGCEHCAKTGYMGRFAVYEIMVINEEIQRLTLQRAGTVELREAARKTGMATLEESAYYRIASGDTSLEEVMRVTLGEA